MLEDIKQIVKNISGKENPFYRHIKNLYEQYSKSNNALKFVIHVTDNIKQNEMSNDVFREVFANCDDWILWVVISRIKAFNEGKIKYKFELEAEATMDLKELTADSIRFLQNDIAFVNSKTLIHAEMRKEHEFETQKMINELKSINS